MELRRATAADADGVAALFRASYAGIGFLPALHTPAEDRAHFARVVAEQEVWLAEAAGDRIGFAALSEQALEYLYVVPGAQGRGVGTALFRRAQERRPDGFTLWVFQGNERARRFYELRGCRLVRLTDGAANEEREPDAVYEWRPQPS